jgi:phosphoribosylaminoimidazolecarboxamide formyltransferase/IMP cyclohydrolase
MIRAAAKNFSAVLVVVDPADFESLATTIAAEGLAGVTPEQRRQLAAKAFAHVSAYDAVIADYLRGPDQFPQQLGLAGQRLDTLRYGENPHQAAAVYRRLRPGPIQGVGNWRLLGGKEMSFNNYLDTNAARLAALDFSAPTIAIIKHANPCGIASRDVLADAFGAAFASDPVSAFGGVVASNTPIDEATAELIAERFFEVVVAPGFASDALDRLRRKKNLRLVEAPDLQPSGDPDVRFLDGGFLVQEPDLGPTDGARWQVVTEREPTAEELRDLVFAWRAVRHVKSNAIVLAKDEATVGVGGGQPNRVDAVRIAVQRAGERSLHAVLASDAFFPFADNIDVAAAAGITAIAQPGGSVRDNEVIAAADATGIAMVFTGRRHFRH